MTPVVVGETLLKLIEIISLINPFKNPIKLSPGPYIPFLFLFGTHSFWPASSASSIISLCRLLYFKRSCST